MPSSPFLLRRPRGVDGSIVIPALLFLLAAYLRLERLWLLEFKRDEAVLADRALSFLEGRSLPLWGNPSGAGVFNPPGFVYLMSLPLAVWSHPLAGSAFLGILGALAVVGIHYLGRRYFGSVVGPVAAVLYAVNPWAIWFSRHIWEPDSVQPFVVLFFLALYSFVASGSGAALGLSVLGLAFLTQLHFSTAVLAPVWLVGLFLGRKRISWRALGAGVAISLASYAPYVYGDYSRGWVSLQAGLSQPLGQTRVDLEAFHLVRELVAGFRYFLPDDLAGRSALATVRLAILRSGEELLLAIGLAAALWLAIRGDARRRSRYALLLAWAIAPLALATRHWMSLHVHYFLTALPALALLCGVGASALWSALSFGLGALPFGLGMRRRGRSSEPRPSAGPGLEEGTRSGLYWSSALAAAIVAAIVAAIAYSQLHASRSLVEHVAAGERQRYGYGVPIVYTTSLADYLASQSFPELWVVEPTEDLSEALSTLLRHRSTVHRVDGRKALPLPRAGGAVYVVLEDGSAAARLLSATAAPWRVRAYEEAGRPIYSVYRVSDGAGGPPTAADEKTLPASAPALEPLAVDPAGAPAELRARVAAGFKPVGVRLDHGLTLEGALVPRAVRAGETIEVSTLWRVDRDPASSGDAFVAFAHLVGSDARPFSTGQDYAHEPSTSNLAGEWVTFLRVPVPDDLDFGVFWLDHGLYRAPGIRPVAIADGSGRSLGTQIRLGPLKVEPRARRSPAPEHLRDVRFGEAIRLVGFDLVGPRDGEVRATLYWKALGTPPADYQAFVHLVDATGRLVAQHDAPPGAMPTSLWDRGDWVADPHVLRVPGGLEPDQHRIRIGLYLLSSGARLPVSDGTTNGDYLDLGALSLR